MRKITLTACLLVTAALALTVHAGFTRNPGTRYQGGSTRWSADVPSPVSMWQRDQQDDLYPTPRPIVLDESIRYYDGVATNEVASTGVWMWDANKDVYINPEAGSVAAGVLDSAHLNPWYDVEFRVDVNGDIYARK